MWQSKAKTLRTIQKQGANGAFSRCGDTFRFGGLGRASRSDLDPNRHGEEAANKCFHEMQNVIIRSLLAVQKVVCTADELVSLDSEGSAGHHQ